MAALDCALSCCRPRPGLAGSAWRPDCAYTGCEALEPAISHLLFVYVCMFLHALFICLLYKLFSLILGLLPANARGGIEMICISGINGYSRQTGGPGWAIRAFAPTSRNGPVYA